MILDRSRLLDMVDRGWYVIGATDETDAAMPFLLEVTLRRGEQEEIRFVDRDAWEFAISEMQRPD
jgi:hypothetical protein